MKMKHIVLLTIMAIGCSALKPLPPINPEPEVLEVTKPHVEPVPEVTLQPIEITPRGELKPALKYHLVGLPQYEKLIPRVEKFFQILVTDKTILDSQKFKYTTDSADDIRKKIMSGFDVKIETFKPTWISALKWRYTIAYHEDWTIHLNAKKLNRPECEVINTIAHESTHAWSYEHGDDSPWGKGDSVPYWVGKKAEEYCLIGKI